MKLSGNKYGLEWGTNCCVVTVEQRPGHTTLNQIVSKEIEKPFY